MAHYRLNHEIKKESKWAIQRTHNVTGAIFYLSPGESNWVSPKDHDKYGTRYGRWMWVDAEEITAAQRRKSPIDFEYLIVLHANIK